MLSTSSIQLPADGRGLGPLPVVGPKVALSCSLQSHGSIPGSMEGLTATSSNRTYSNMLRPPGLLLPALWPQGRPPATHASPGESQTRMDKSGAASYGSLLLSLGFWCTQDILCAPQSLFPSVLCKFYNQILLSSKVRFPLHSTHSPRIY